MSFLMSLLNMVFSVLDGKLGGFSDDEREKFRAKLTKGIASRAAASASLKAQSDADRAAETARLKRITPKGVSRTTVGALGGAGAK